ncbi:hypothetical protein [Nocardioides ungokensis]|uniref:hypothetical protein n=1 Tax=Nocardioides ungokensis TaxID=1643322 RepID=UPI0015DE1F32|nr:hypothetical protein [Nocardioides ungokensis]
MQHPEPSRATRVRGKAARLVPGARSRARVEVLEREKAALLGERDRLRAGWRRPRRSDPACAAA